MSLTAISGGGAASVPENTKPEYTKSIGQQRMMQSAVQSAVQSVDETASSKGLPAPMPHANRADAARQSRRGGGLSFGDESGADDIDAYGSLK